MAEPASLIASKRGQHHLFIFPGSYAWRLFVVVEHCGAGVRTMNGDPSRSASATVWFKRSAAEIRLPQRPGRRQACDEIAVIKRLSRPASAMEITSPKFVTAVTSRNRYHCCNRVVGEAKRSRGKRCSYRILSAPIPGPGSERRIHDNRNITSGLHRRRDLR